MEYHVKTKPSARKELEKIPKNARLHIIEAIDSLSTNPRPIGYKKLVNFENHYRIRVNVYRVIYEIRDKELIVEIVKVGHRKEVYR